MSKKLLTFVLAGVIASVLCRISGMEVGLIFRYMIGYCTGAFCWAYVLED